MKSDSKVVVERAIINVNPELCLGCGQCLHSCPLNALVIEGNQVCLAHDTMCAGGGACLGHCCANALFLEIRTAEKFDPTRAGQSCARH